MVKKSRFTFGRRVNLILFIFLILATIFYFVLRYQLPWVSNILPDIISIGVLSLLISVLVDKETSVDMFAIIFGSIFFISIGLFIYGLNQDVQFLVDTAPEFIAVSFVTVVISLVLRRKLLI